MDNLWNYYNVGNYALAAVLQFTEEVPHLQTMHEISVCQGANKAICQCKQIFQSLLREHLLL